MTVAVDALSGPYPKAFCAATLKLTGTLVVSPVKFNVVPAVYCVNPTDAEIAYWMIGYKTLVVAVEYVTVAPLAPKATAVAF